MITEHVRPGVVYEVHCDKHATELCAVDLIGNSTYLEAADRAKDLGWKEYGNAEWSCPFCWKVTNG